MQTDEVQVVTITLARSKSEEETLLAALCELKRCGATVVAADGGSRAEFIDSLKMLGFSVVRPSKTGLVQQVKAAVETALKSSPRKPILYTEPDKYPFFQGPLVEFVRKIPEGVGPFLSIVARDGASFATFPAGQQWTESFMNRAASIAFQQEEDGQDFCYGPLLLSPECFALVLDAPDDLGWGWRFYVMARAKAMGMKVILISMDLSCPSNQRSEDSRADRLYRLKQLRENLAALELAAENKKPALQLQGG